MPATKPTEHGNISSWQFFSCLSNMTRRPSESCHLADDTYITTLPLMCSVQCRVVSLLKANDKNYPVSHKHLPRFLYPEGHKLIPGHEEDGLFEGHFIIYVCFSTSDHVTLTHYVVTDIGLATHIHRTELCIQE